jgi:hypothetical protein
VSSLRNRAPNCLARLAGHPVATAPPPNNRLKLHGHHALQIFVLPSGHENRRFQLPGHLGRQLSREPLGSPAKCEETSPVGVTSLRKRPLDILLVFFFCVFATSSLIYEQFVVFGVDLSTTTDIFGRSWYWYARSFDPVFLDPPLWLRIMCTIDAYVFGAMYLVLIFAFVKGRNWVRIPALLYGSAIVYSTIVYFSWEFLDETNRAEANLLAVFVVNIPYTIVPLLLMWRVRHPGPFSSSAT